MPSRWPCLLEETLTKAGTLCITQVGETRNANGEGFAAIGACVFLGLVCDDGGAPQECWTP